MSTQRRKRLSWIALAVAAAVVIWQGAVVQRAQKAQHQAETRWELSISGSLNGMFDCQLPATAGPIDWSQSTAWYSPHFTQLLGLADGKLSEEGSLCAFLDLVHKDEREPLERLLDDAIHERKQVQTEIRALHNDGTYHWYLLSAAGSHNHMERVSGAILDVTHAKEEQRRSDLIILSSPQAIIVCDHDKHIILMNAAAEEMFGWPAKETLGQRVDRIVTLEYLARHDAFFDAAIQRLRDAPDNWQIRREQIHGEGVNRNGRRFPVTLSIRGIKYRGRIEFIATIQKTQAAAAPPPAPESLPLPQQQLTWQRKQESTFKALR
jgi:PAS domain S-box-containing protein